MIKRPKKRKIQKNRYIPLIDILYYMVPEDEHENEAEAIFVSRWLRMSQNLKDEVSTQY